MAKILIIDDEPEICQEVAEGLSQEGYECLEAVSGEKGLELLEGDPVELVITDIIMPGKSGNEIIHELRRRWPDLSIIAMSGGGRTVNMDFLEIAKKQGADRVIEKPFDIDEITGLVRELLPASPKDG